MPSPILMEPFTSLDAYLAWAEDRPDEEHYEVVDGQPVMSPSPTGRHQLVLARLLNLLHEARPTGYVVLPAPLDWVLWEAPRLQLRQPDIAVIPRPAADGPRLVRAPLLAVEVLSPSSVERDVVAKRSDYARAGIEHYWIVDPEAPQVAIYRRDGDELTMAAKVIGEETLTITDPVSLALCPQRLLD